MREPKEGFVLLDEALAVVGKTGERYYEAELYRLKGELLLAQEGKSGSPAAAYRPGQKAKIEGAKACFLKAIDIARHQEAKSWELRASTSLARLWQKQGKTAEARQMLAEIYGWLCVQQRLARSAGESPAKVRARAL